MRSLCQFVAIAAACAAIMAGCAPKEIVPMPGRMSSDGLLLKTQELPLGGGYVLQRRQILRSPCWNDFYPLNVPSAKPVQDVVSRLYVVDARDKRFVEWVRFPEDIRHRSGQVSRDGDRIVFERPEVDPDRDGEYPMAQPRDVRPRLVAVYSKTVGRVIEFDTLASVYAVSHTDNWRGDNDWVAFTAFSDTSAGQLWGLTVVNYGGEILLSPAGTPELVGLEFIAWSPDGRKVAALRSARPRSGGELGGDLVEVDVSSKTVRTVAAVPAELAANHLSEYQEIVAWPQDQLMLSPPR